MQAAGACGASTEGHTTMAAGQDATELLGYLSGGRQWAADELMPLVHEVYMKLVDQARVDWQSKTHFKAVAAQAMYRAPVDHARARNREKRGGTWRRVRLYDARPGWITQEGPRAAGPPGRHGEDAPVR